MKIELQKQFRKFVREEVTRIDPDFVDLLERRGRIFVYLDAIPEEYKDRVRYSSFFHMLTRDQLKRKRVAVLDDSAQFGRTLQRERRYLEKKEAIVSSLCLVRRKSTGCSFLDTEAISCLEAGDDEFVRLSWEMLDYIRASGTPLDVDHPAWGFSLAEGFSPEGLFLFLSRFGHVAVNQSGPFSSILSLSLERPHFFNLEALNLPNHVSVDGITKIRWCLDLRERRGSFVPIVCPSLLLRIPECFASCKTAGRLGMRFCDDIQDFHVLDGPEKAEVCHRCLTTNLSTELGLRMLMSLKENAEMSLIRTGSISLSRGDLFRLYGELGSNLEDWLAYRTERVLTGEEHSPNHVGDLDHVLPSDMHEIDEREKALFKIIQIFCEDFSAVQNGEGEKADRIGLTYNELKARCIQNGLPAGGLLVSVAVDVLGDSGMIKPLTEVRTIQKNAEYFAARSYILGENGGGERSITLPPAFLRREKLQYAIAAIVDGFARHGHPIVSSKMLHKALANLKKDWRNVDLPYEIKASHWGPIAYLVQDDIYEPCSLVEFLGHYCPHVKKSSPYSKLYEVETGWDKDMHGPSMDPSELYAAQGYADVYALLSDVKAEMDCSSSLDGHAHSYNAMLVFSMCRTWQQAYLYCQKATEMWEVDLMYLLSRLKGSKGKSLEAEVRRLSSKCASLRQKLEGYSLLPALKNTVRASPAMRPLSALVDPILGELDDPVRVGHLEEAHKAHSVMSTCTKMLLNTLSGLGLAPDTRSAKEKEEKKLPDYVKEFNEQSQFADPIESSELEGKVLRKDVEGVYGVFSSRFVTVANYLQSNVPRPEVASLQFMERLDEVAQDIFRALESMNLNEASVLFCDLTNYSGLFEGKDTPETTLKVRHLIEALDELVNRILLKYKLGLVKEIYKLKVPQPSGGDAWLICFVTPEDAIVAASEIQQTRNSSGLPPVKMGVARGYVTMYKTNEIGLCINKAQRISQLASPDGICVDGQLVEILKKVQAKEGLAYKDIGEHDLKGVGTLRVSSLDWRSAEVDKWEKHGSVS